MTQRLGQATSLSSLLPQRPPSSPGDRVCPEIRGAERPVGPGVEWTWGLCRSPEEKSLGICRSHRESFEVTKAVEFEALTWTWVSEGQGASRTWGRRRRVTWLSGGTGGCGGHTSLQWLNTGGVPKGLASRAHPWGHGAAEAGASWERGEATGICPGRGLRAPGSRPPPSWLIRDIRSVLSRQHAGTCDFILCTLY